MNFAEPVDPVALDPDAAPTGRTRNSQLEAVQASSPVGLDEARQVLAGLEVETAST